MRSWVKLVQGMGEISRKEHDMIAVFYWVLLLLALVLGGMGFRNAPSHFFLGSGILIWVLFVLIGLKLFGNPLT